MATAARGILRVVAGRESRSIRCQGWAAAARTTIIGSRCGAGGIRGEGEGGCCGGDEEALASASAAAELEDGDDGARRGVARRPRRVCWLGPREVAGRARAGGGAAARGGRGGGGGIAAEAAAAAAAAEGAGGAGMKPAAASMARTRN